MKRIVLIAIILFFTEFAFSQQKTVVKESIKVKCFDLSGLINIDTIWFTYYTKIDTIKSNYTDTVYLYFENQLGKSYDNGDLMRIDSATRFRGRILNGEKTGKWDVSDIPDCLSQGIYSPEKIHYYKNEWLPGIVYGSDYFLGDTINGFQPNAVDFLSNINDTLYYSCYNSGNNCNCTISILDGIVLKQIPLELLFDEFWNISTGAMDREIKIRLDSIK
ncbi:MAG: hypothetical protein JEZ09_01840 [Salinivirgaceae bacterium]|nr:hypothetical protein [Salinivirgaceae bacterium]